MYPALDIVMKAVVGIILGGAVKIGFWVHEVKTNHLPHLQVGLDETRDAVLQLPSVIERQTTAIVGELREQRQDIRNLTTKL